MENSIPDTCRRACALTAALLLTGWSAVAPAQDRTPPLPEIQTDMPITIDADSSEFDYETSRLVFRGLRVDQGTLGIEADLGETDKLDFTDGVSNT